MSVTIVHASGSWREIGRGYGEHLRDAVRNAVAFYHELAPRFGGTVDEIHRRLAPYAAAAGACAPERYAELAGMAEGASIRSDDAMFLNCIEELIRVEACTTVGTGDFLIHAEMWYRDSDDIGVLVASPPGGPTTVTASCVGFLTGVGASSAGFAQGVQSTFARDERVGVPRVLPSRAALCAGDVRGAVAAATMPNRAGGYGYVLSTVGRHRILETSATRAELLPEAPGAVHTNHYLTTLAAIGVTPSGDSSERLTAAGASLAHARLESLSDCQALLSRDGFRPCAPTESTTVFGFACDLRTGAACVSDGDPRDGRWTYVDVPNYRVDAGESGQMRA